MASLLVFGLIAITIIWGKSGRSRRDFCSTLILFEEEISIEGLSKRQPLMVSSTDISTIWKFFINCRTSKFSWSSDNGIWLLNINSPIIVLKTWTGSWETYKMRSLYGNFFFQTWWVELFKRYCVALQAAWLTNSAELVSIKWKKSFIKGFSWLV